jgi:hypothetical protein
MIKTFKPVSVSKAAFAFCRYTVAILVWLAFILKIKWLVVLVSVILALSAMFTIKNAPLILIYSYTIDKIFPSKTEILDAKAMRFAHILGTILSIICIALLYCSNETIGWIFVFVFALLKTVSAFGFCPASKLYGCMISGGCCALTKR